MGKLTACVTHEMNGPLAFMRTNLRVLGEHADRLGAMAGGAAPDAAQLAEIARDTREIAHECLEGLDRIGAMVQSLRGLVQGAEVESLAAGCGSLEIVIRDLGRQATGALYLALPAPPREVLLDGRPAGARHSCGGICAVEWELDGRTVLALRW